MQFKIWLETYRYLGQCDHLRRCNEGLWQQMMSQKQPVSMKEFLDSCDLSKLLDEGETVEQYFDAHTGVRFYKSMWGNAPCYFFQTHGFEFIFTP